MDEIDTASKDLLHHPVLNEFFGEQITHVAESVFPNGFYRFSRPSFVEPNQYIQALVRVWREDGFCFVRGLEAKAAFQQQGLPWDAKSREYRGTVMMQEEGIDGNRSVRMVFEHLDRDTSAILNAARNVGFCAEDDLPHFHKRLLRVSEPFK